MQVWRGPRYPDSPLVSLVTRHGGQREGEAVVIGCGNGRHVRMLNELGFDAYGVEPDPQMAQAARDNGIDVIETDLDSFEPRTTPQLVVAWGLLMVVRAAEAKLATLGAPRQIINWRSEANSYIAWNAHGPTRFDHGVSLTQVDRPGYLLDGRVMRSFTEAACHLPGHARIHSQHMRIESEGIVHGWYQTVHQPME